MGMLRDIARPMRPGWAGALATAAAYAALTVGLAPLLGSRHIVDVVLVYLLVCLASAAAWGFRVGLASAVAAQLLVNFFYVPPIHKFTVQEPENVVALMLFLAVAAVGASMLSLLRRQVQVAAARQAETSVLLELSQQAAHAVTPRDAMERLCSAMTRALHAKGCAILRLDGAWQVLASSGDSSLPRDEAGLAMRAMETGQVVRFGGAVHSRIPSMPRRTNERSLTFVPFRSQEPGVLRIDGAIQGPAGVGVERLLLAFADEASVAVHRARLAEEARRVEALEKADEFKTALLSSVSHDLRSPLTAIKASIDSLRDEEVTWSDGDREAFLETIESQTDRLSATVSSLLEMGRLEGGAVRPLLEPWKWSRCCGRRWPRRRMRCEAASRRCRWPRRPGYALTTAWRSPR
jgi:two-component system, OmpR family, sensor histidine kinase KdpD